MRVITTIEELHAMRTALMGTLGFVPTMGFLHEGHLDLVRRAVGENDQAGVSIFVNPTQFGKNEDFAAYPRNLENDLALLEKAGVGFVFAPSVEVMYPTGFQTYVEVMGVSQGLEGASRPGHFRGVATVVAKLFNLVRPSRAYFGQKDAQQVAVIRRMVSDLAMPVTIIIVPTVREPDGLAKSSRNVYLAPTERAAAPVLYQALSAARRRYEEGERHPDALRTVMGAVLATEPRAEVVYLSAADAETLSELSTPTERPILLSLAVRIGRTRLIDNLTLETAGG
ncbi:MAG: pantoate--beta-alanine ligase [Anaerolineales bacterium]|nr:pantoate--beta-alanine ligase [Anaerolineales bacterium]